MRISDWSSDVCSSDLARERTAAEPGSEDQPRLQLHYPLPRRWRPVPGVQPCSRRPAGEWDIPKAGRHHDSEEGRLTAMPTVGDLHVEGVSAWYGQARVLHEISINVPAGSVVAVFGHNGAGKSTLLRSIAGVHTQCGGQVTVAGGRLDDKAAHEVARSGLIDRESTRLNSRH